MYPASAAEILRWLGGGQVASMTTWTMEARRGAVRSLLIPLSGCRLLLPSVAVAEVVPAASIAPVAQKPGWLVGTMEWRFLSIPVLSFEMVSGSFPPGQEKRCQVAVLRSSSAENFYGLLMQGIPNLIQVRESELTLLPAKGEAAAVAARVEVCGQLALIPDLDALERRVRELQDKAGQ